MSAYRLLMLLGFVCQGLASQDPLWALLFALIWALASRWRAPRPVIGEQAEAMLFAAGLFLSYYLARTQDFPLFVCLGYPLLLLQTVRLTGKLDPRKRLFCIAIAITHVAIGSQAVFDFQIVLILLAALVLIPRSLAELEAGHYDAAWRPGGKGQMRATAALVLAMAAFFILVPRARIRDRGGALGFVTPTIDPSSGGGQTRDRLLFKVEGERLGYLKTWALDTYDSQVWSASEAGRKKLRGFTEPDPARHLHRTVAIQDTAMRELILPVDGHVVAFEAEFLSRTSVSVRGTVHGRRVKGTPASTYEYWTDRSPVPEPLDPSARGFYTALPEASPRVARWLEPITGSEADPLAQAQRIATHLRETFTYRIGAPSLDRISSLEDFLFNQKEGHCERFASALTILLRMKGIPARVAIGFLPLDRYRSGTTQNLTEKQGHAWTEAWFEDRGWVDLDATPYSDNIYGMPQPLYTTAYEWIQDFWYQRVVFFSSSERLQLLEGAVKLLRAPLDLAGAHLPEALVLGAVVVAALGLLLGRDRLTAALAGRLLRPSPLAQARHAYGRMLRELERRGHRRRPAQTPLEFLAHLRSAAFPGLDDVEFITESFCATRYGGDPPGAPELERLEVSLRRLSTLTTRRAQEEYPPLGR